MIVTRRESGDAIMRENMLSELTRINLILEMAMDLEFQSSAERQARDARDTRTRLAISDTDSRINLASLSRGTRR